MEYKIEDYSEQLKQLCSSCKSSKRCKDKDKLCILKRSVWTIAKIKLKRREKVGVNK